MIGYKKRSILVVHPLFKNVTRSNYENSHLPIVSAILRLLYNKDKVNEKNEEIAPVYSKR